MSTLVHVLTVTAVALLCAGTVAQAQPFIPPPVPQVQPQFNNPGPQIAIPPPGNPVKQLSPIASTQPPGVGQFSVIRHPHHRRARVAR
jgi:hypothetical protein